MRREDKKHLDFIRSLPCIICGNNIQTEAAHIRMADGRIAKPITGNSIKPDDCFTLPLCGYDHRRQHEYGNERKFWQVVVGIDACLYAMRLYTVSGDYQQGLDVLKAATRT